MIFKGTTLNGSEETLPVVNTTVTQVTKIIESTVVVPSTTDEIVVNGPSDGIVTSEGETIVTTMTEEITKTTTVLVEGETSVPIVEESVPIEALTAPLTDGMDTSE